jgi:hypothetical protein
LESKLKKKVKADLDLEFLLICRLNNIVPSFLKFKIYNRSLYNSDFYQQATQDLLLFEIRSKEKLARKFKEAATQLESNLKQHVSILDCIFLQSQLFKFLGAYSEKVRNIHNNKLSKVNIIPPSFDFVNNVIFNHSSYALSKKESFLLSLGLDFSLPCYKPSFVDFFLPFEQLAQSIKPLRDHTVFQNFRKHCTAFAHKSFSSSQHINWYPFIKPCDFALLKNLGKNESIVITKPDKGKGVVILDRTDYNEKINTILADQTKFQKVDDCVNNFKLIYKIEDKINRCLLKFKNNNVISAETYSSLHATGSSYGILYGSPKVHKGPSVPIRPILAAYNLPNFKLAKHLVPLLSPLTTNQYSVKNSFEYSSFIISQNSNKFLVSFDVESLFTNIPIHETINIILDKLFPTADHIYHNYSKIQFKTLLELAVCDTHFLFNNKIYKQSEGMAMGSPLGPTFANIFMNFLETSFLNNAPINNKPSFYNRYIDDILCGFDSVEQASLFLNQINNAHPNIKFTMEPEASNKISFLDISITRSDNKFRTNVFRKNCFTGQGLNYYSYCSEMFKINSCKTLINRAYNICSDWSNVVAEFEFLADYFKTNCYPNNLFPTIVRKYLDKIYHPTLPIPTVPRKEMYFSFAYTGFQSKLFKKSLTSLLTKYYPLVNVNIIFHSPLKIGTFFRFKDALMPLMRSKIVYIFTCPNCTLGTKRYIGCTERLLKVRIEGHRGVSHRTQASLATKEASPIREHCNKCKNVIKYNNFKILQSSKSRHDLLISESLLIKYFSPCLNNDQSSTPLYIA